MAQGVEISPEDSTPDIVALGSDRLVADVLGNTIDLGISVFDLDGTGHLTRIIEKELNAIEKEEDSQ